MRKCPFWSRSNSEVRKFSFKLRQISVADLREGAFVRDVEEPAHPEREAEAAREGPGDERCGTLEALRPDEAEEGPNHADLS